MMIGGNLQLDNPVFQIGTTLGLNTGGGAARWAPYPAPPGYRWDFVTSNGQRVTAATARSSAEPVVSLVGVI